MRYTFLSLFAIASLASCTSVDRRTLAEYDDGYILGIPTPLKLHGIMINVVKMFICSGMTGTMTGMTKGTMMPFTAFQGPTQVLIFHTAHAIVVGATHHSNTTHLITTVTIALT